jgi:lysozyme
MKTSANGRTLIEEFEGLILGAYDDFNDKIVKPGQAVRGTLTIGYGHTSAAGPPRVYAGMKITKEQADSILAADLASVEIEIEHLVKVSISQNQFDALVSFHFNTGGLGRSSTLRLLNQKKYQAAADALLAWNRAGGKVLQGLVRRRNAERKLFLAGG